MKRISKACLVCLLISALLTAGGIAGSFLIERDIHFTPEYEKIDLLPLLEKETLSDEDYKTLFYQTGLGARAIDELRLQEDFAAQITAFQETISAALRYNVIVRALLPGWNMR